MLRTTDQPRDHLENVHAVLDWIPQRYEDLLNDEESTFIADFTALPHPQ